MRLPSLVARLPKSGATLILLDEPTNDLDVISIRAPEVGFERFASCAVVVSHHRSSFDVFSEELVVKARRICSYL